MALSVARPSILPRLPALAVFGMVGFALLGAVAGRATHTTTPVPQSSLVEARDLRFEDRADGAVMVFDGHSATPFQVLTGENGFLRGTLRGLARTRHAEGIDAGTPFRLSAWSDNRLTLDDPATGRHIELEAFGSLNEAVFARLLLGKAGA